MTHLSMFAHANHRHVGRIANVANSISRPYVRVFQPTLEVHLDVDQNVSQVPNALRIKLASTRNALIHALVYAVKMQFVAYTTIVLYVAAKMD